MRHERCEDHTNVFSLSRSTSQRVSDTKYRTEPNRTIILMDGEQRKQNRRPEAVGTSRVQEVGERISEIIVTLTAQRHAEEVIQRLKKKEAELEAVPDWIKGQRDRLETKVERLNDRLSEYPVRDVNLCEKICRMDESGVSVGAIARDLKDEIGGDIETYLRFVERVRSYREEYKTEMKNNG